MLVAIVTAPRWPADKTISASLKWFFAFNTSCGIPSLVSNLDKYSEVSTATVPTKIGCPLAWRSLISRTTAANFDFKLGNSKSG